MFVQLTSAKTGKTMVFNVFNIVTFFPDGEGCELGTSSGLNYHVKETVEQITKLIEDAE